nr:hypothetical protein [Tanacetum cinerariifolium]GEZ74023.1 hypothetical protein [Tanacetum cinerariifolium]
MGAHNKNSLQSKADQTVRISKSVFVSNFPDGCTAKDLWKAKGQFQNGSYVNVVNGSFPVGVHGPSISSTSVLVLDDSCVTECDLSNHVMGVKSWCHVLQNAIHDFVSDERIVWVDIEGIPLNVWSCKTFTRIGKKWGEALDIEDNVDSSFGRKHRSQFCEEGTNDDRVSDVEEVSGTNFGDNSSIPINHIDESEKQQSKDPFNIYRLLRKQPGDDSYEVSSSLSHPPGFTSDVSVIQNENGQSAKEILVAVNAKVMDNSQDVYKEASCDNVDPNVVKKGGSVLGVMEDMIRVGKAMGYSIDGCVKDLEQIIGPQGVSDVPR